MEKVLTVCVLKKDPYLIYKLNNLAMNNDHLTYERNEYKCLRCVLCIACMDVDVEDTKGLVMFRKTLNSQVTKDILYF